jgi:hypothetical protein
VVFVDHAAEDASSLYRGADVDDDRIQKDLGYLSPALRRA